jgi:hypothetical protein
MRFITENNGSTFFRGNNVGLPQPQWVSNITYRKEKRATIYNQAPHVHFNVLQHAAKSLKIQ